MPDSITTIANRIKSLLKDESAKQDLEKIVALAKVGEIVRTLPIKLGTTNSSSNN